jgi:hypothetical protein
MATTGVLIVFAALGAFICAKARSAGGAIAFSLIALVLFVSTPAGAGLPGAVAELVSTVQQASQPFTDGSSDEGSGAVG